MGCVTRYVTGYVIRYATWFVIECVTVCNIRCVIRLSSHAPLGDSPGAS